MKTRKQQLIDNPLDFENEENLLNTFFSERLNKFCLMFNGQLFAFKTWNDFLNKRTYFIKKYNLTNTNKQF